MVGGYQQSDVRSEYSGIRGGGRVNQAKGSNYVTLTTNINGQPINRANTIHRALLGPHQQPLRPSGKVKRKTTNGRKNQGNVSLKTEIRGTNVHEMNRAYASSNQPQRSHAVNSRGVSGSQVSQSTISAVGGSVTSK